MGTQSLLLDEANDEYSQIELDCPEKYNTLITNFVASGQIITKVIPLYTGSIDSHLAGNDLPSEAQRVAENAAYSYNDYSEWYDEKFSDDKNKRTKEEFGAIGKRINEYVVLRYVYSKVTANLSGLKADELDKNEKQEVDEALGEMHLDIMKQRIKKVNE